MLTKVARRYFSQVNSSYQNNLDFLFKNHSRQLKLPYFAIRSGNIEILKEPIDFYIALHVTYYRIMA